MPVRPRIFKIKSKSPGHILLCFSSRGRLGSQLGVGHFRDFAVFPADGSQDVPACPHAPAETFYDIANHRLRGRDMGAAASDRAVAMPKQVENGAKCNIFRGVCSRHQRAQRAQAARQHTIQAGGRQETTQQRRQVVTTALPEAGKGGPTNRTPQGKGPYTRTGGILRTPPSGDDSLGGSPDGGRRAVRGGGDRDPCVIQAQVTKRVPVSTPTTPTVCMQCKANINTYVSF